ncbi:annexin ANXC4 [Thermoascus aurantiacus ATCC 26904]
MTLETRIERDRSKSPGGRARSSVRERSRSRASRAVSPRSHYDDDESRDDRPRYTKYTSSAGNTTRTGSRMRSKYDRPEEYYLSQDEEEYYRSHISYLPSEDRSTDWEDEDDEDDDAALAYGEAPLEIRVSSGKHYKLSSSAQRRPSSSKERAPSEHLMSGGLPSYAKPERFTYAQPAQFSHAKPPDLPAGYSSSAQAPSLPPDWAPIPECERPGYVPPASMAQGQTVPGATIPGAFPHPIPNPQDTYPPSFVPPPASTQPVPPAPQYANLPPQQYVQAQFSSSKPPPPPTDPVHPDTHQRNSASITIPQQQYADLPQWQYAHPDPGSVRYSPNPVTGSGVKPYTQSGTNQFVKPYTQSSEPQVVEVTPGAGRSELHSHSPTRPTRPHSLSIPSGNNLSVGGHHAPGVRPPPSPLLEPYHGTYQSISPMPSPIARPSSRTDESVSELEPLDAHSDSDSERRRRRRSKSTDRDPQNKYSERRRSRSRSRLRHRHERHDSPSSEPPPTVVISSPRSTSTTREKRVSFYNATSDALAIKAAIKDHRDIDPKPLIRILPHLTHDETLALRAEYRKQVRYDGMGISMAKHIKLQIGAGAFGKACYATALGRWKSEAYWANCYYQSSRSRRELLIEALMGRTNAEIHQIKACFRDSKYRDNLVKCMKEVLRADKFCTAVLLALEERRQEERDPVDMQLVQQDVHDLRRGLVNREGGETAMIQIIVVRSDAHLREVLRLYKRTYGKNFAKEMIAKSRNLVGETLTHILNGALNRPLRDAQLLHQALRESRPGRARAELLTSRLVRLHWEPRHLEHVKIEFRRRYGQELEAAIQEVILGIAPGRRSGSISEWGQFCLELARSSAFRTRG